MARELELGNIDLNDRKVPYWLRFLSAIDHLERGQSPRWPSDTRPEYAAPFEVSQSVSEILTTPGYMVQRVRDVLFAVEGVEPDAARVAQRAEEMLATRDMMVMHPEDMNIPESGVEPIAPISAGSPNPTAEEIAAEQRTRADKLREMVQGRRS